MTLNIGYDFLAGIPHAGQPLAAALFEWHDTTLITLTKTSSDNTRTITSINAKTSSHWNDLLLIDDLITAADTKLEAIAVARQAGFKVSNILVLVDRKQGGRQELLKQGCMLHSIFSITQLLRFYHEQELIAEDELYESLIYLGEKT